MIDFELKSIVIFTIVRHGKSCTPNKRQIIKKNIKERKENMIQNNSKSANANAFKFQCQRETLNRKSVPSPLLPLQQEEPFRGGKRTRRNYYCS